MTAYFFNPYVFGLLVIVLGELFVLACRRAEQRTRTANRRTQKNIGHAIAAAGLAWMVIPVIIYDDIDNAKFTVTRELPRKFTFVPAIFQGDTECRLLDRDFCELWVHRGLSGHDTQCVPDPMNIRGYKEQLQDGGVNPPLDTFFLRGTVNYNPLTGICKIFFSQQTRGGLVPGQLFETRYRCSFQHTCP